VTYATILSAGPPPCLVDAQLLDHEDVIGAG
jgi:hypothetical protein